MKKIVLPLLACLFSGASLAASTIPLDNWEYVYNGKGNTRVWSAPGDIFSFEAVKRGGVTSTASGTGFQLAERGVVALGDGRVATLTASRLATAGSLAQATARLAAGPVGIVAVLAIPAVYNWYMTANPEHVRVNQPRTGVEKKDDYTSACQTLPQAVADRSACNVSWAGPGCFIVETPGSPGWCSVKSPAWPTYLQNSSGALPVWKPSTMDDIIQYMTPRPEADSYPLDIARAGAEITVTPVSVTGPSPALVNPPNSVKTTNYSAPPVKTSTTTTAGNPWGLPANTPTQTGSTTGTAPLSPGNSTSTGPLNPSQPTPGPVNTPTTTTTTSTWNPTTDQTTSTTTTTQDSAQQVSTTTNITNVTNTTNTSTVINNSTTTTTITNTTTNTPLAPPKVETEEKPLESKDPCDAAPDRVACLKLGDPPAAEKLTTKTTAVSVVAATFASSSACPAPIEMTAFNRQYLLPYTPICEKLAAVKYLVVLMGTMAAAMILAGSFKV